MRRLQGPFVAVIVFVVIVVGALCRRMTQALKTLIIPRSYLVAGLIPVFCSIGGSTEVLFVLALVAI